MRQSYLPFLLLIALLLSIDSYIMHVLLTFSSSTLSKYLVIGVYILVSLLGYIGFNKSITLWRSNRLEASTWSIFLSGFSFVILTTKVVFLILLVTQDIGRLLLGLAIGVGEIVGYTTSGAWLPERNKFLISISGLIAAIPFFSMLYGITQGKYKYTIDKVKIKFKDLPAAFEGFKIAQISDAHSGTWDSLDKVIQGINMIQALQPDMIVFTGDLVNESKDEINPFIDLFASLSAPYGKYAILGNHDYYGQPKDPQARIAYWEDFYAKFKEMGFDLLLNANRTITKNGQHIKLLGVENWGGGRWFPKFGDLDKALHDCTRDDFCILLSHDPTHWDEKVLPHRQHIALTLSGHTHGMQFGLNFKYLKWSPVQYRYKRWIGLYQENEERLYINRGFGFLAFPGRVGMWPEITLIELGAEKPISARNEQ